MGSSWGIFNRVVMRNYSMYIGIGTVVLIVIIVIIVLAVRT